MYGIDQEEICSDAQATTSGAQTDEISTNVIDKGVAVNLGGGNSKLCPFFRIHSKAGTTTSLRVKFVGSAAAALTSPTILYDTGVLSDPAVGIYSGTIGSHAPFRYYGFLYTTVGTSNVWTITAGLSIDIPNAFGV